MKSFFPHKPAIQGSRQPRRRIKDPLDWGIAFFVTFCVLCYFFITCQACSHWFIFPVFGCGWICMSDAVCWLRGKWDTFDPKGMAGPVGFHVFFVAPLLHVAEDAWTISGFRNDGAVDLPADMRPWLGRLALLNLVGFILYQICQHLVFAKLPRFKKSWSIRTERVPRVLMAAISISIIANIIFWSKVGGLSGMIEKYSSGGWYEEMAGTGVIMTFSDALPILVLIMAVIGLGCCTSKWQRRGFILSIPLGISFAILQFVVGGLRGSRSNTVFAVVWAAGIIHYFARRMKASWALFGIIPVLAFMYYYGFYKSQGEEALEALGSKEEFEEMQEKGGKTLTGILLADMGRMDLQAYVLYRLSSQYVPFDYAYGQTYLAGLLVAIPRGLRPSQPQRKHWETDALHGEGSFAANRRTSMVFGMAGEALINFGPLGVPVAFAFWGALIGLFRRWLANTNAKDMALIVAPGAACLLALSWPISDLENVVFRFVKDQLFIWICVWLMSKTPASETSEEQKKSPDQKATIWQRILRFLGLPPKTSRTRRRRRITW